jgi:hypothetical protein
MHLYDKIQIFGRGRLSQRLALKWLVRVSYDKIQLYALVCMVGVVPLFVHGHHHSFTLFLQHAMFDIYIYIYHFDCHDVACHQWCMMQP